MMSSVWDNGKLPTWEMQPFAEELYFPFGRADQPFCSCKQRAKHCSVKPAQCFAKARRIPTAMKGDYIRDPGSQCPKHCKWCYEVMVPLAVDKVPRSTSNEAIDAWREVVVLIGRPGTNPVNLHTLRLLNDGESAAQVRRQDCDLNAHAC